MSVGEIKTICIYGAGALGGAVAAKLATGPGDVDISVVARGAHLEAIRQHGLRVTFAGAKEPVTVAVTATDNPAELAKQDLVITGLKGHQLPPAASGIASLLKPQTRVAMILNGIPWWYFHRDATSGHAERQLSELDPDGALWREIGPERVIGCVAHQGAEVVRPGEIQLSNDGRFIFGEPSGEMSADLEAIQTLFSRAGLNAPLTGDIRYEIWNKLTGNAAFNPLSALTRALMTDIMADPPLFSVVGKIMREVRAVAEALGVRFEITIEQRIDQSRQIGPVRTSMLQDLLAGRALELTPLVGMVVTIGRLVNIPTPISETVMALAAQLDIENRRQG